MLLNVRTARAAPRLAVLAWDIACPRRARRVRTIVEPFHHARQYSVREMLADAGDLHGILAEVASTCDMAHDRIAVWWPRNAERVEWRDGLPTVIGLNSADARSAVTAPVANVIVCYDVCDGDRLETVAAAVSSHGARLQRSVYWLRMPPDRLRGLIGPLSSHLAPEDRLWSYPLAGAHLLWQIGTAGHGLLPVGRHRWLHERSSS